MIQEIPGEVTAGKTVALHWSRKRPGWGVRITDQGDNDYGVWVIGPVNGNPTARLFHYKGSEQDARTVANEEWVRAGL